VGQFPAPSQFAASVWVPPEQDAVRQLVVETAFRQPPLPSQVPSSPQVALLRVQAPFDEPPAVTGLQTPVAHVMQVPPHAVAQQTCETQLAWVHWSLAVQPDPSERVAAQVLPLVQ
jgi:hypothetical protein